MPLWFLDEEGIDVDRCGKKAAHLHQLLRAGFRVPLGFVLSADLDVRIMSDEVLREAIDRVGGFPVAVRSSGLLEDLAEASFAGQYESFLNVVGLAELRDKIGACRGSATSSRVQAYLRDRGLDPAEAQVSVLIQRMVQPEVAGVAFSIDPVSGREEHALVECCRGLGEKLVAGRVSPSRYVLEIETGDVVEESVAEDGARLEPKTRVELCEQLLRVQAFFHHPQDVEWAVDPDGTVWIVQSRAITTVQWRSDIDEYTNADFKDGGISARVCTPLMFSLYRNAFQASMQEYAERIKLLPRGQTETWIRSFYGRGYWNASAVKRMLTKVPGFREQDFDRDLGIQKDYGADGPRVIPTNARTIARAIPIARALEKEYEQQLGVVRRFAREFPGLLQAYRVKVARFAQTDHRAFEGDLKEVLLGFHARTERAYFTTIYSNANAQSDFKGLLRPMDRATGRSTSLTTLMGGLSGVHHMKMQRGICHLYDVARDHGVVSQEWHDAQREFLGRYGFHSDAELDLTVPRWYEVPQRIEEIVLDYLWSGRGPADPEEATARQRQHFNEEVAAVKQALRSRFGLQLRYGAAFDKHLRRVRSYLSAREEMREYSTQCYAVVRAYVLEAGRRWTARGMLERPDDIFMLTIEEIAGLVDKIESPGELRVTRQKRRLHYDGYRDLNPPNELGRGVEQRARAQIIEEVDGRRVMRGLGCSPGVAVGTVRVIRSLDEVNSLVCGDVLVTRFTDPGWTPALGRVAGVVTEVGGILSHAAVIGREYGIPAVLDLAGATDVLRSGQRVRIDGSSGLVEVLGEVPVVDGVVARTSPRTTAEDEREDRADVDHERSVA